LCNVIFLESFEGSCCNGDYLFSIVLPYLVSLHLSGFNVQTYVRHNPFGIIRNISCNDLYYNMLFEDCTKNWEPKYCTKAKFRMKM
jgi:hypothetical protein